MRGDWALSYRPGATLWWLFCLNPLLYFWAKPKYYDSDFGGFLTEGYNKREKGVRLSVLSSILSKDNLGQLFPRILFLTYRCCHCCPCCLLFFLRQLGTTLTTFSSHITSVIQVLSSLSVLSSILSKDNLGQRGQLLFTHHFCHTFVVVVVCVVFCSSTKAHCAANPSNLFYPCSRKN